MRDAFLIVLALALGCGCGDAEGTSTAETDPAAPDAGEELCAAPLASEFETKGYVGFYTNCEPDQCRPGMASAEEGHFDCLTDACLFLPGARGLCAKTCDPQAADPCPPMGTPFEESHQVRCVEFNFGAYCVDERTATEAGF